VPNLVEEKCYLLVSSSDQHYHCKIEAERGPPETQARDSCAIEFLSTQEQLDTAQENLDVDAYMFL